MRPWLPLEFVKELNCSISFIFPFLLMARLLKETTIENDENAHSSNTEHYHFNYQAEICRKGRCCP